LRDPLPLPLALRLVLALAGLLVGCATAPGPVTKIVNGRVVVARAISPEAYEHVARALLYEEEERWEEAARELQRALPFDDEGAELRAQLANLFIRLGRTDDAAEQVKRSLEIAESVDGRLAAAHVAEVRHEEKAALLQYQAAATLALADQKAVASETDQGGAATDIDPDPQEFEAIERTHLALADAHLGALNMMGAYQAISTLRDVSSDSLRARIELGALAWALGRLPECEAALQEALRLEPSELDARLMLAGLLVATGRTAEAKLAFREALERSEDSVDIAEMYLKWLVARGDRTEADEEVARLTPDTVDDTNFETVLRLERAAGQTERVRMAGDAALKKGAPASRVSLLVAGALLDAKDRSGAAARLESVPRESPDFVESRLRIAEALRDAVGAGPQDEAGRALDEAAKVIAAAATTAATSDAPTATATATGPTAAGKSASSPAPRAVVGAPAGRDSAAAPGAGARSDPAGPRDWATELIVARALWEEKRGDAIRAARTLDAALSRDPDNPRLLLVRGAIDERRGDWRHALGFAEKILASDPRQVEALNFHGFVSVDHDSDLPTATRRLQVAMALDPGAGGIVDSLGWAYLRAGDLPRASEFLIEADRLEPGDPEIQAHLGELLARQQDIPRAIAMYRRALQSEPAEALAREINSRLRALEAKSAAGR